VAHCPLFPYLNDSLLGWREAYCDTEATWTQCARYRRSVAGDPVPLALLPNGRTPIALARSLGEMGEERRPTAVLLPDGVAVSGADEAPDGAEGPDGAAGLDGQPRRGATPSDQPESAQRPGWWRRTWMQIVNWMRAPA
jgi:hypothetical protein